MFGVNKKVITAILLYVWITKGLYNVIGGPTMIDLMLTLNLSIEEVARAFSALGIGPFPAIIASAFFTDRFGNQKNLVMAVSQTVAAISVFSVPFIKNVHGLWCVPFVTGIANTVLNFVGQRILLETWAEKSPSPMHAMHMGFGIGALLAPLLANPFLAITSTVLIDTNSTVSVSTNNTVPIASNSTVSSRVSTAATNSSNVTTTEINTQLQETLHVIKESRVQYVFIIISLITLVGAFPFWYFQARKCMTTGSEVNVPENQTQQERKSFKEILNPANYTEGSMVYGICIIVLICIIYINAVGGEHSFGTFVRTYSVDVLKFSKDNASYLNLTYWFFHALGRFFSFIIALWIPIRYLFFIEVLAYFITSIAVHLVASRTQLSLWIFTAVVGFVVSPIYGSGITYANTQVEVRGIMLMSSELSGGLGVAFYVWMTGYMYDFYGPRAMLIAMLISGIAVFVSVVLFLFVGYIRGNRFDGVGESVLTQQMAVLSAKPTRNSVEENKSAEKM